ncbi:MAG: hypothetical protein V7K69_07810 [Nostoc sp.]
MIDFHSFYGVKRHTEGIIFIVMQQLGIKEALTTDHHFEQAGFIRLLKSE